MSRSQIYVVLKQAIDPEVLIAEKQAVWNESGLAGGLVINCESDTALINTLKWMGEQGHYAAVKMLGEDEPWPARQDWINETAIVAEED